MRKIFIDVGGYEGTSVLAALDPIFGFDQIFCFEPAQACVAKIARIKDRRLVIIQAGLSNRTERAVLYNAGTLAASVFADAPEYERKTHSETIDLMSTALFFRSFLRKDDKVYMKLNCEGSELDILESILNYQVTDVLANVLIDLDALKIPSQRHRVSALMDRVREAKIPFLTPQEVQYGMVTNFGGVRNWLLAAGAKEENLFCHLRSLYYNLHIFLNEPQCSGYHKKLILDAMPILSRFARSRRGKAA